MDLIKEMADFEKSVKETVNETMNLLHTDVKKNHFSIREDIEPDEALKAKAQSGYQGGQRQPGETEQKSYHYKERQGSTEGVVFVNTKDGVKQIKVDPRSGRVLSGEYEGQRINVKDKYVEITPKNVRDIGDNRMKQAMMQVLKQKEEKGVSKPVYISKEYLYTPA